nr:MAG TPA: hypothetical protein [Caudoviricetes sp.]
MALALRNSSGVIFPSFTAFSLVSFAFRHVLIGSSRSRFFCKSSKALLRSNSESTAIRIISFVIFALRFFASSSAAAVTISLLMILPLRISSLISLIILIILSC